MACMLGKWHKQEPRPWPARTATPIPWGLDMTRERGWSDADWYLQGYKIERVAQGRAAGIAGQLAVAF